MDTKSLQTISEIDSVGYELDIQYALSPSMSGGDMTRSFLSAGVSND